MDALGVISRLGAGHLIENVYAALLQVAEHAVVTDTPGTVTVTFKLSKVADMPAVTISEQIKTGLPTPKARGALFFSIGDGELHTSDPRQIPLEFRVVEDEQTGVRTFSDDAPEIRRAE